MIKLSVIYSIPLLLFNAIAAENITSSTMDIYNTTVTMQSSLTLQSNGIIHMYNQSELVLEEDSDICGRIERSPGDATPKIAIATEKK